MNRVERAFRGVRSFAGDVWVADYTEQTRYKLLLCELQDEQLKWIKKNKIHLMGYNEILIVNEGILLAPPPVI